MFQTRWNHPNEVERAIGRHDRMAGNRKVLGWVETEKQGEMKLSPDLHFTIETAEILRFAASPHIVFKLQVTNSEPRTIHTVILRCQIQLDVSRRRYNSDEQQRLADLFGEPSRWGETLRALLWTHASIVVPPFDHTIVVDLPISCTF